MSQHISRKELRTDEIRDSIVHGAEAALSHQKMIYWIGGALITVLVLFFGWKVYTDHQTVKAAAVLEDAMKVFQARIRTAGEPEEPGEVTYIDEKNKYEDAAKKFLTVANSYSMTRPGRTARYYAALSYDHLEKTGDAVKLFREVEGSSDSELAALARYDLASLLARTGKGDDAVKLYQSLIANPTTMRPKSGSMFALAQYYEGKNPAEATKIYNDLKKEFPGTSIAQRAAEQLEALKTKS
ncbi:MAG: tetratricopeptide repeat protein [Acidobacteria bacterium]|nr:tetratricopeptide repeat protein [Acidobacteriota bacterium]